MIASDLDRRPKVLFILWSLHGGGAERFAVHLMNHVDPSRFDMRMALVSRNGPYLDFLDPAKVISPDEGHSRKDRFAFDDKGNQAIFKPSRILRAVFLAPYLIQKMIRKTKPDLVVSFCKGTSAATMAALWLIPFRKFRWIARDGNNISAVIEDEVQSSFLRSLVTCLTFWCYRSVDVLLCVTPQLAEWVKKTKAGSSIRCESIFNGVDTAFVSEKSKEELPLVLDRKFFLSVGRLGRQKAFDVLIRAYAQSRAQESIDLVIIGKGPDEEKIRQQIRDLGLEDKVHLVGWQKNPYAWMAKSLAFISSSRWEGCPNAVLEAMAAGAVPVLSDCDFGHKEIIQDGVSGFQFPVENERALSQKLDFLVENPNVVLRMKESIINHIQNFEMKKIIQQYEELFLHQIKSESKASEISANQIVWK